MKRFLFITLFIIFYSQSLFAYVSVADVYRIYNHIVFTNNIQNAPKLNISRSSNLNACYFLGVITVNHGMMLFVNNNDEMAVILGHELAHFMRGHWVGNHKNEYEADHYGVILASKAGYNVCRGSLVVYRFNSGVTDTHPDSDSRYAKIRC